MLLNLNLAFLKIVLQGLRKLQIETGDFLLGLLPKSIDFILHQTKILSSSVQEPPILFDMRYLTLVWLDLVLKLGQQLPRLHG